MLPRPKSVAAPSAVRLYSPFCSYIHIEMRAIAPARSYSRARRCAVVGLSGPGGCTEASAAAPALRRASTVDVWPNVAATTTGEEDGVASAGPVTSEAARAPAASSARTTSSWPHEEAA